MSVPHCGFVGGDELWALLEAVEFSIDHRPFGPDTRLLIGLEKRLAQALGVITPCRDSNGNRMDDDNT